MSSPLAVTYRLNLDDVQAAQWHLIQTSPTMRRNYRLVAAFALLFTLVPVVLLPYLAEAGWWVTAVLSAVVVVLWVFQFPRSYRQSLERNTAKLMREGRNALLNCAITMEIDERNLAVRSELGESRVTWDAVERVAETDGHIFIHLGSLAGHAVPKWAFENNGRAQEFFEAASEFQRRALYS